MLGDKKKTSLGSKNISTLHFRRIVEKLKESHRHKEAGQVLVEHLNDPEEAFVAFIEGQLWNEAVQLMHSHNRLDLFETNLKPAIIEASEEMLNNLDKKMETFNDYLARLKDVVIMKERLAEGRYNIL